MQAFEGLCTRFADVSGAPFAAAAKLGTSIRLCIFSSSQLTSSSIFFETIVPLGINPCTARPIWAITLSRILPQYGYCFLPVTQIWLRQLKQETHLSNPRVSMGAGGLLVIISQISDLIFSCRSRQSCVFASFSWKVDVCCLIVVTRVSGISILLKSPC